VLDHADARGHEQHRQEAEQPVGDRLAARLGLHAQQPVGRAHVQMQPHL
jgi:hypothetical protein